MNQSLPAKKSRLKRWARRLLAVAVVCLCLYLFRVPLLRGIAWGLVHDESLPAVEYILVLDGDTCYPAAASLWHAGAASRVLVIEARPERLERLGILPSFELEAQRELSARGVPKEAITIVPGKAFTDWEKARCLRDWLRTQKLTSVAILCERFHSRKISYIYHKVMDPDLRDSIYIDAVSQRDYNELNWWHHKPGVQHLFTSYLELTHAWMWGEDSEERPEWNPDEFEKSLRPQR
jgi:hypothetical protein